MLLNLIKDGLSYESPPRFQKVIIKPGIVKPHFLIKIFLTKITCINIV